MSKKITALTVCLMFIASMFTVVFFANRGSAFANDNPLPLEPPPRGMDNVTIDYIFCEHFHTALLDIANDIRETKGLPRNGSAFKVEEFEYVEALDLRPLNPEKRIRSLSGIEYLDLKSLRVLILDDNLIEEISFTELYAIRSVHTLSVRNNGLRLFDMGSTNVFRNLDLSDNYLTEIDLRFLEPGAWDPTVTTVPGYTIPVDFDLPGNNVGTYQFGYHKDRAYVNLVLNSLSNLENLLLPSSTYVAVDLFLNGNMLVEATPASFSGHTVSLLLQGFKRETLQAEENEDGELIKDTWSYTEGDRIRLTGDASMPNFNAKITYRANSINKDKPAISTDASGLLTFVPGRITLTFYDGDTVLNDGFYETLNFDIMPKTPTFRLTDREGNELTGTRHANYVKVELVTGSEDFRTFIQFEQPEPRELDYIEIRVMGSYWISGYVQYDGVTSVEAFINITLTWGEGMGWAIVAVVGAIILALGGYYGFRWYRDGAIVAPLSDKEIASMEKRRGR
jgi:hypothetical protein